MTQLKNDRYLRALLRQPVDMTPVWMILRQAGRYLPLNIRQSGANRRFYVVMSLMRSWRVRSLYSHCVDMIWMRQSFSDILTIPDAMGLGLSFGAGRA